jgi:hypothetical protein
MRRPPWRSALAGKTSRPPPTPAGRHAAPERWSRRAGPPGRPYGGLRSRRGSAPRGTSTEARRARPALGARGATAPAPWRRRSARTTCRGSSGARLPPRLETGRSWPRRPCLPPRTALPARSLGQTAPARRAPRSGRTPRCCRTPFRRRSWQSSGEFSRDRSRSLVLLWRLFRFIGDASESSGSASVGVSVESARQMRRARGAVLRKALRCSLARLRGPS